MPFYATLGPATFLSHSRAQSGRKLLMQSVRSEQSRVHIVRNRSPKYGHVPSAQQNSVRRVSGDWTRGPEITGDVKSRATLQPSMKAEMTGGQNDKRVPWPLNSFLLPDYGQWSRFTDNLVRLSTFVFVFLLVPQLVQNGLSMAAGNVQALGILAWQVKRSI